MNVEEIKKAMTGRRVAGVNDTKLQEALRLELTRLANMQGKPIPSATKVSQARDSPLSWNWRFFSSARTESAVRRAMAAPTLMLLMAA